MKIKSNKLQLAILAALATQAPMLTNSAIAQPALQEIVVTSTRREVNVQDVPVAITAISGEMLETQNIENSQDLMGIVPNLMIRGGNGGSGQTSINMRGIPDVGTYVDGVWQVSNFGFLQREFVELERLEVLRGPQGTLYGRDSTGGSIQLFTKRPDEEFGALVKMGIGSFDRRDVSASIDVPITETLLTKWTLASNKKDGYVTSINNNYKYGNLDNETLRGDILWTPTDRFSARLIYSDDSQESTTARIQNNIDHQVAYNLGYQIGHAESYHIASLAVGGPGFDPISTVSGYPGGRVGEYETTAILTLPNTVDQKQTVLHLDYELSDNLSIKYIYGDTSVESQLHVDYAGSEFNFFSEIDLDLIDLTSHEIQLNGDFDRFHWNVGYYTWEQTNKQRITEISMSDYTLSQIDANVQKFDYDDVLASDTCSASPADQGVDFEGQVAWHGGLAGPADDAATGWLYPCNWAGGNGWPGVFAGGPEGRSEESTRQDQEGDAFFGQITFDITDKWDITGGVRYHDQTNTYHNNALEAAVAAGVAEARPERIDVGFGSIKHALAAPVDPASKDALDFDNTSYRFATSYDVRDNIMVYFGYNEGFNSGGISSYEDSLGLVKLQYDPETIENMELGMKGDFMDGRLRANVTIFSTDWVDIQLQSEVFDRGTGEPLTTLPLQNAASGESKGIEIELTYAATDALLLGANLGFLDTKYTDVPGAGAVTLDTDFGGAPEETYNLSAQYNWDLSGGNSIMARIQGNYFGDYFRSENPILRQQAYGSDIKAGDVWLVNARLEFIPADGNYKVALWGNNLTDSYNLNSGFMHSIWQFDFAGVDAPREVGISIDVSF